MWWQPGPIAPPAPFYVIGDIHGRLDLLEQLLERLPDGDPVICLGDYIDRGKDSAGVVRYLRARSDILCVKGNHEAMLLAFLDAPDLNEAIWLHNGGLQTLESFGAFPDAPPRHLRDALVRAMGQELIAWLRAASVGECCSDPCRSKSAPCDRQAEGAGPAVGASRFWPQAPQGRDLGCVRAWITAAPFAVRGVVAVDTGAFRSGCLTAARIERGGVSFFQARDI